MARCCIVILLLVMAWTMTIALVTHAHVIGVDFGSEFLKIAGPHSDQSVDIVLNELSKRKTDNYLGFRNGERYIGDQAKTLAARFPLLTVAAVNQLMGMKKGSPEAKAFADMKYEYEVGFDARETVAIPVKDEHGPFTAEELYSMFLTYAEAIALKDGVVSPRSAVVTIPFHASIAERRSILEAAKLSQVDILGFLHSTTAAAMYYGIRRRGFENRNVTLVVFDIGTTHTEAGVYRFSPPEVRKGGPLGNAFGTLSTVTVLEDKTLGGRALDLCVAGIIEKEAMEKMGIKAVIGGRSPPQLKSQFSLLRAANKVREVLSANSKIPFTVEGIVPDRDFHSVISRETYETECAPLFTRVKELAQNVLASTGLKPSQIDAFELMGGAARTPKIIADLSSVLGREVDRTLNMDEAAAIGAAFYGVKLSPFYRVKSFKVNEQVPFSISFVAEPPLKSAAKAGAPLKRSLFTTEDKIGHSVSVSLNRTSDFALKLFDDATGVDPFAEVAVAGVEAALDKINTLHRTIPHPNNTHFIRVQLRVNETGLVDAEDAEIIVRFAANTTRTVEANETAENGTAVAAKKKEFVLRMKQTSRKLKVAVKWFNPRERTATEMLDSETKLFDILEHERRMHEIAEAKNKLEGFIFWIKGDGFFDKDDLVAKAEPKKREALRDAAEKTQLWLEEGHGSSDSCTRGEFEKEHAALKKMMRDALGESEEEAVVEDGTAASPGVGKTSAARGPNVDEREDGEDAASEKGGDEGPEEAEEEEDDELEDL